MSSTSSSLSRTAARRLSWSRVALTAAATALIAAQRSHFITCVNAQGALTPLAPQCGCSLEVNGKAFPSDSTPGCSECSSFNLNCAFGGKRRRLSFSDGFGDGGTTEPGGVGRHPPTHSKDVVEYARGSGRALTVDNLLFVQSGDREGVVPASSHHTSEMFRAGSRSLTDTAEDFEGPGFLGRGVSHLHHHPLETVSADSRTLTDLVDASDDAEPPEVLDEDVGDYEDGGGVCCCPGHLTSATPAAEPPGTPNPDEVPETLNADDDATAEPPTPTLVPSDSPGTVADTASDSPDTPADTAADTNSDSDTDSTAPEDSTQASPDTESDSNNASQGSDSASESTSTESSTSDGDGDEGESDPGAVIGGIVAAILLIIGGFVGGLVLCWCRGRRRRRGAAANAGAGYDTKEAAAAPEGHVANNQSDQKPGELPFAPLAGQNPRHNATTASTPATELDSKASGQTQHTGPSLVASAGSTAFSNPVGRSHLDPDMSKGTIPNEGVLNAATASNTNSSSTSSQRQDQSATQRHSPADPAPSHGFRNVLFANANDSLIHGMQSDDLKGSETAPNPGQNLQGVNQSPEQQGGQEIIAPGGHTGNTQDTFDLTHTAVTLLAPPGPGAPSEERVDFLHQQLDSFGLEKPAINDLVLLGGGDNERRQGGQAIVQMAMSKGSREEYAIKFFVSRTAFQEEAAMYSRDGGEQANDLVQFLPQVIGVYPNTDKALVDTHGHALPPCIVMERGQSLDIWARRAKPDRPQAYMMMHQLAARLRDLHALGYVHRDLKPGNVMWLPRENRWTLIDFGCVARAGETARMGFSLAYAAPEVIAAYRRGERSMVAKEAVDVWSLGVMAFELLTGGSAVSMLEGKDKVMDRIEGRNGLQLPWDASALTPTNRRKLGIFKQSITMLLSRDPSLRPSMAQFCESCDQVLAGSTTVDDM